MDIAEPICPDLRYLLSPREYLYNYANCIKVGNIVITGKQARIFLAAVVPFLCTAVLLAYAATNYASHYGILAALVSGVSIGAGILFSDGMSGLLKKWRNAWIVALGAMVAASALLLTVMFPLNQYNSGGMYYLNFTGLLAGIPFAFSFVAFLHTVFLAATAGKNKSRKYGNLQP